MFNFHFTSNFHLGDAGYKFVYRFSVFGLPFAVYRKGGKTAIQIRGKEWRSQRDEHFVKITGFTFDGLPANGYEYVVIEGGEPGYFTNDKYPGKAFVPRNGKLVAIEKEKLFGLPPLPPMTKTKKKLKDYVVKRVTM